MLRDAGATVRFCPNPVLRKSSLRPRGLLKLRQPAVSQQLARLRADDFVETRRDGKNIYYSLARPEVRQVIEALNSAFCAPDRQR